MNIYASFTKSDEETRMVYGYASTEALDSQGECVSREAIADALPDYMKFANIREMHTNSAVGKTHEATVDDNGLFIGVKVVDESAWQKVKEGVYNGFSIGGKKITKIGNTITKMKLSEISLVDRPANPEAVFQMFKGEDMADEIIDEVINEVPAVEVEKSDNEVDVKKGLYSVAWLADIIQQLSCLQEDSEYEREWEEDNSTLPEELKAQIKALGGILSSMVAEEVAEIVNESEGDETIEISEAIADVAKSDEVNNDIAKAGATLSKANRDNLSSIIALCNKMMGDEDTTKSDEGDDLAKGEDIAKAFEIVKDDLAKAHDRIKELEAMPEAPKGSLMAISKSDDGDVVSSKEAEPLTALEAMKKAHANPSFMKL